MRGTLRMPFAYCLDEGSLTLDELDYIVFYEKPFVKFERLLETYLAFAPWDLPRSAWLCHCGSSRNCSRRTFLASGSKRRRPALTGSVTTAVRRASP